MRLRNLFVLALVFVLPFLASSAYADGIVGSDLGTFAILGGAGVAINGTGSVITGSVGGCCNATAVTGVIPTNFTISGGTVQEGGSTAILAQGELGTAIGDLNSLASLATPIVGGNLTGLTLLPGVYSVGAATTNLAGTLTLNGLGNSNATWVFLVSSTLITSTGSSVVVEGTGSGTGNVFWNVGTSATLNGPAFVGNVFANQMIGVGTGVTDPCGTLATQVASVTLAGTDTIGIGCAGGLTATTTGGVTVVTGAGSGPPPITTPEPGTFALLLSGLLAMVFLTFCKSRVSWLTC